MTYYIISRKIPSLLCVLKDCYHSKILVQQSPPHFNIKWCSGIIWWVLIIYKLWLDNCSLSDHSGHQEVLLMLIVSSWKPFQRKKLTPCLPRDKLLWNTYHQHPQRKNTGFFFNVRIGKWIFWVMPAYKEFYSLTVQSHTNYHRALEQCQWYAGSCSEKRGAEWKCKIANMCEM